MDFHRRNIDDDADYRKVTQRKSLHILRTLECDMHALHMQRRDCVVENIKIPIAPRFKRGKTDSSRSSAVSPPPTPLECKTTKRETEEPTTGVRKGKEEHNGEKILTGDEDRLPFLRGARSADFYPQHQAAGTPNLLEGA